MPGLINEWNKAMHIKYPQNYSARICSVNKILLHNSCRAESSRATLEIFSIQTHTNSSQVASSSSYVLLQLLFLLALAIASWRIVMIWICHLLYFDKIPDSCLYLLHNKLFLGLHTMAHTLKLSACKNLNTNLHLLKVFFAFILEHDSLWCVRRV